MIKKKKKEEKKQILSNVGVIGPFSSCQQRKVAERYPFVHLVPLGDRLCDVLG